MKFVVFTQVQAQDACSGKDSSEICDCASTLSDALKVALTLGIDMSDEVRLIVCVRSLTIEKPYLYYMFGYGDLVELDIEKIKQEAAANCRQFAADCEAQFASEILAHYELSAN